MTRHSPKAGQRWLRGWGAWGGVAEKQEEMERWLRSGWQTKDSLTGSGFQNVPLMVNSRHPLPRPHLSVSLVFATPLQSGLQLVMTLSKVN